MIHCEWGTEGVNNFSIEHDIAIIVDVLSFSTCVDIALSRNAFIYPYRFKDETAIEYAKAHKAVAASLTRSKTDFSLSPASYLNILKGTKVVLPSPNGSELSFSSLSEITLCACFRNYKAVAKYANSISRNIIVVPAGEKWANGSIRFAIEDYLGAGAVLSELDGEFSSEALIAKEIFINVKPKLKDVILKSISAKELIEKNFTEDIELAMKLNEGVSIPKLVNNYYFNMKDHFERLNL